MANDFVISVEETREAARRIQPYIRVTPFAPRPFLTEALPAHLKLKLENLQVAGSFKSRGAFNNLLLLDEETRRRGIVAASGGNHGYSLTYAAKTLGLSVTIVLPETATPDRVQKIAQMGGTIISHGKSPSEAIALASQIAADEGKAMIHPFDGRPTWQGTGTLGLEIYDEVPDVDCVLVAIGGGGLISGVATVLKQLKPGVKIIGVEPVGAASMQASLQAGVLTSLESVNTIADTLSPRSVSESTLRIAQTQVDALHLVSDQQMLEAMRLLWKEYNQLVEPAGAAVLAAVIHGLVDLKDFQKPVAIICGGNAAAGPCFDFYAERAC